MAGRKAKYPWPKWTDGNEHKIYAGSDYEIPTMNMQISLHGHARAKGFRVTSRSFLERTSQENRYGLRFTFSKDQG